MGILVRAAIFTRWGRFALAGVVLIFALYIGASGFVNTDIKTTSGILADGSDVVDQSSGAYQYSELTLQGDSTTYRLDLRQFTPALNSDKFFKGGTIDLWYTVPLFAAPHVVAVQVRDEQDENPVKYVTSTYTNPAGDRTSDLIGAGVILLFAVALALAGALLPTEFGRKRRQPAPVAAVPPQYQQPGPGYPPQGPGAYGSGQQPSWEQQVRDQQRGSGGWQ